jgi:hypothetical protein
MGLSGAKRTGKVELLSEGLKIVCTNNWLPETSSSSSSSSSSSGFIGASTAMAICALKKW